MANLQINEESAQQVDEVSEYRRPKEKDEQSENNVEECEVIYHT